MTEPVVDPVSSAAQDSWRPIVSQRTLTWVRRLLIAAGVYWYYTNRHSGDLVLRGEAVALVLMGLWAHHVLRVKPPAPDEGAL